MLLLFFKFLIKQNTVQITEFFRAEFYNSCNSIVIFEDGLFTFNPIFHVHWFLPFRLVFGTVKAHRHDSIQFFGFSLNFSNF